MQMECPKTPEECCDEQNNNGFGSWFCEALCIVCCCTIEVTGDFTQTTAGWDPFPTVAKPTPPGVRDYPAVTPTGSGIEFTKSEYGGFLPIVYGADKMEGNVFWYSGFKDKTYKAADGSVALYRTVSFAMGLCEGEINNVLRVWVADRVVIDNSANVDDQGIIQPTSDGFILGATVNLLATDSPLASLPNAEKATRVSIFTGAETQVPEGAMADIEGYDATPGYRGVAYILFENFIVEDTSIPAVSVEVLSNTTGLFPRLYFDFPTVKDKFDRTNSSIVTYDARYDQFTVRSADTGSDNDGFTMIDGNTLTSIREVEVVNSLGLNVDQWSNAFNVVTSQGNLLSVVGNGNAGTLRLYNTVTGTIDSSIGPGGGLGGNNTDTNSPNYGVGAPQAIAVMLSIADSGVPADVFAVAGASNFSMGFGRVDKDNNIKLISTRNGQLERSITRIVPLNLPDAFVRTTALFSDNVATKGKHFYTFSHNGSESDSFQIFRWSVDGPVGDLKNPVRSSEFLIDFDELNGKGVGTSSIVDVYLDPVDCCFVLFVDTTATTRPQLIVKWSPYTNKIIWKSPARFFVNARQTTSSNLFITQKLAFFSPDFKIYAVDTATGIVSLLVDDIAAQALASPTPNNVYYNGYENSLTYVTGTSGKRLTKVFLERVSRSSVGVANIVTGLLKRVGLRDEDIDVLDLTALSLDGYTINSKKTLRAIFAELAQVFRFDVIESNGLVVYKTRGSASIQTIPQVDLKDGDQGWLTETRIDDFAQARKINLTYRDIGREYADNVQSLNLPKYDATIFDGDAAIDVAVPIVLTADRAKSLAEVLLYSKIVYSTQYSAVLPFKYLPLDPADVITLDMGDSELITMRLRDVTIGNDRTVSLTASKEDPDIYNDTVNLFGNVGRFNNEGVPFITPRLDPWYLQIPFTSDAEAAVPAGTYVAYFTLLNTRIGTRVVDTATIEINEGEETITFDTPTTYPTWGIVTKPLDKVTSQFSTDRKSVMEVKMVSIGPLGAPLPALSLFDMIDNSDINLAYVGDELIQFRDVTALGDSVYRFSVINRGLFNTESKAVAQKAGKKFILLGNASGVRDTTSIVRVPITLGPSPKKIIQTFLDSGNPFQGNPYELCVPSNLRPSAVAFPRYTHNMTDTTVAWDYRARYGGDDWLDGTDTVTRTEPNESYVGYLFKDFPSFSVNDNTTYLRKFTVTSPSFVYTVADQLSDGFDRTTEDVYCVISSTGSLSGNESGTTNGVIIYHI